MTLSNYSTARAKFFSPIESLPPVALTGSNIEAPMTLILKDIKGLLSYFSVVHTREPIAVDSIDVMPLLAKTPNETIDYNVFIETTKLDDKPTFYFQATTFVNKAPLIFSDSGLLGEKNIYKPFDSSDSRSIESMLSLNIDEIRSFSDQHFKFRTYRGIVGFQRVSVHTRGYTVYLSDRDLYLTIIASKHDNRKGTNTYVGILYSGG